MDGFKKPIINDDRDDLIKEIDRKKITIEDMENKMHVMKHLETMRRRASMSVKSMREMQLEQEMRKLQDQLAEEKTAKDTLNEQLNTVKMEREAEEVRCRKMVVRFRMELSEKTSIINKLNDELVDLKGQIRVAVRVRDYGKEHENFTVISQNDIKFEQNGSSSIYHFEHLFRPEVSQSTLFSEVEELILCALNGRNVCLIAYGPTGSGKTFTMRGDSTGGVIPNAINFLLEKSAKEMSSIGWKYNFSASFVEVYNEEVLDLLNERKKLEVKTATATTVVGLRKLPIKTLDDVTALLQLADSQRSTASTACNLESSRSHAIFQVYVEGHSATGETVQCCLSLVDLAGSERAKESGAQGKQFTELKSINKSLTNLKMCIRAQMTKAAHVPFRDSKLTLLLREYLGAGSSKTMFIAHVNPRDVSETKRTLEFTAELRSTNLGKANVQTGQK